MGTIQNRKALRLKDYDYSQPGNYSVTICTQNMNCLFGKIVDKKMKLNSLGIIANDYWKNLPTRYPFVELDKHQVMPNHIHGIMSVRTIHKLSLRSLPPQTRRNMLLSKIIGFYKMKTAKQINILRNTPSKPVWQRSFYDHVIRNEKDLERTREYIINNPENWKDDLKNKP
jgi:REP-associated tyrosine transposase